jgi:hypothetical protein
VYGRLVETVVILVMLAVLAAAAVPGLYALRKRMVGGGPLEFWRVLHRRGLSAADTQGDPRSLAIAVRRCVLCPSVEECAEWLESGEREGLEEFCPNAPFLKRLEHQ